MILTGPAIREHVERGTIEIDPFVPEHVNPASVDLTLGDEVLVYDLRSRSRVIAVVGDGPPPRTPRTYEEGEYLDAKKENPTRSFNLSDGIILEPGEFYLLHTVERVYTKHFVPVLDGKSSLGRLTVSVHQTAGYGDPGFNGQYTLEVTVEKPVRLYVGMRVAQMRFHTVMGEIELYGGNYVEETARGPVASRSWRQFQQSQRQDSEISSPCYICEHHCTESEGARSIFYEDKYRWLCWECRVGK